MAKVGTGLSLSRDALSRTSGTYVIRQCLRKSDGQVRSIVLNLYGLCDGEGYCFACLVYSLRLSLSNTSSQHNQVSNPHTLRLEIIPPSDTDTTRAPQLFHRIIPAIYHDQRDRMRPQQSTRGVLYLIKQRLHQRALFLLCSSIPFPFA